MNIFDPTAWGTPVGLGFFLVCLGVFIFLASRAGKTSKK